MNEFKFSVAHQLRVTAQLVKKHLWLAALGLLAIAPTVMAQARDYPSKPVKVFVPLAVGSGGDSSTRFFAERVATALGQPFVVENAPGAGGVIAVMAVKRAPADGYTILAAGGAAMSVNPLTLKELPYDPFRDFKPVSGLIRAMNGWIVPESSNQRSLADLVAASKRNSAPLNVGTYSAVYQLAHEWFGSLAGVKFNNIPYKGGAPVAADVIGRQLDFAVVDLGGVAPLIKSGRLRALAVSGEARHPDFPGVPTIRESGFPDYVNYAWNAFYVRAETPDDVVAKLADALQKVLATSEAKEFAVKAGIELMPLAPAAMRKFQLDEYERYRRVADAAGIRPQ